MGSGLEEKEDGRGEHGLDGVGGWGEIRFCIACVDGCMPSAPFLYCVGFAELGV
jgi:hypothetical protein